MLITSNNAATYFNVDPLTTSNITFSTSGTFYYVTNTANAGGTISPPSTVPTPAGMTRTLAIAANIGFAISNLVVDGVSLGRQQIVTFTNLNANHIRHNVLWNIFNGGVFMLGWATGQQFDLQNLDLHDNVIFRAGGCCDYDRKAPISMKLFGSSRTVRDIRVRNLVIEDLAPYGRWIDLQAAKGSKSTLRDFTIENVSLLKTWKVEGEVAGNAAGASFENLVFTNVTMLGQLMTNPAVGGLNLIKTKGVLIQGKAFADMISSPPDPKPQPTPATAGGGGASQSVNRVGPNLLANPSFEAGWDGWRSSGPPGCALVSKADQASNGTNAVRFLKADRSRGWIEQDITELLKQAGPGDYTWAAKVRGGTAGIPVKASLVVEDESGTQQHPAPDAQTLVEDWVKTERRTPIKWGELKRAALRIESTWGPNGEFFVDECWLSR